MNVKLCGLMREDDVQAAQQAEPTHVGFLVHAPDSHRDLDLETASELASTANRPLQTVLVTPSDDAEEIAQALEQVNVDVVQATGEIEPDELVTLAEDADVRAWKGMGLADRVSETVERIDAYGEAGVEAVVLDSLIEGYGGRGDEIDWAHAAQAHSSVNVDVVLAGGLTPDNVADAIDEVDPWCVDVSSGIETDEEKDPDKMRAFVDAVEGASG